MDPREKAAPQHAREDCKEDYIAARSRDPVPVVSVIMATYNGASTIRASINSILSQTFYNLELIVVDDCSTDETLSILESYSDPRITILRNDTNLNAVVSRNRCLEHCRGGYVAMLDHDDLSTPTRIAKQVAHLDANPDVVLVGTAANILQNGKISAMNHPIRMPPDFIKWLLHINNPIVCSSVMFRADVARRLDTFMRSDYRYADDFDFYHRMATLGRIDRLDEVLTIYRLHSSNTYIQQENVMHSSAIKVLTTAYALLLGDAANVAATLIMHHISGGKPIVNKTSFIELGHYFERINRHFIDDSSISVQSRDAILLHSRMLWLRMLRATVRNGSIKTSTLLASSPDMFRTNLHDIALLAVDSLPLRRQARSFISLVGAATASSASASQRPGVRSSQRLSGIIYEPLDFEPQEPPKLYVCVDTEAEFDWRKPFRRDLTSVTAMESVGRGQAIFDIYGLRPIYVVDYPIASNRRSSKLLLDILKRGGCEIGAHLHPWTTPPFEEELSEYNSYVGNLEPAVEERKLSCLVQVIEANFGIKPVFYKAGRYGFGPETPGALARLGLKVDLSILPGADLRRTGGPDFSNFAPAPYQIAGTNILSVPMTRFNVGLLPSLGKIGRLGRAESVGRHLRLPSLLARSRLADVITLTPEGVTAEEQIRLIRTLLKRGYRQFVLHYHSPSLSAGHTSYCPDEAGVISLLSRISVVCKFFFEEVGGLPGYPTDLLQAVRASAPGVLTEPDP